MGISVAEISLQGRFHDSEFSELQKLIDFCDLHSNEFSFPDASQLILPTRYKYEGYVTSGKLHEIALRAVLVEHCDWYRTFTSLRSHLSDAQSSVITFGLERCVPTSHARGVNHGMFHKDVYSGKMRFTKPLTVPTFGHDQIAVIGMSCRVPGANDLEAFWTLLCENKSQHVEVPSDRFTFNTPWRNGDSKRKWFANFVQDSDGFDNKFFNKSPREVAAMDPQQKMMLQAAYQAVEQSGCLRSDREMNKRIGCYIGVSNVDYQDNVACHPPTAYTATGTLMSFVAGKVSHYFGWTGPSMSIDTACSGSAVAVHEACRAILSDDCSSALVGGVNAITSPLWFQNLAGASFLSPTGPCKPFDAKGDGYCRGEAVGAVFLKRMSAAIADGDLIYGAIAATAVQQNENCTAITVPNSLSLSDLFQSVIRKARVDPHSITVVEAHGTGTAVGDPAEYDAIRTTFGGQRRPNVLALRSVKGLVGHSECASGIVALIKTLLMIHKNYIAPQASHDTLNPALNASPSDKIDISTHITPWVASHKTALINNYGASGSNASMVITEVPPRQAFVTAQQEGTLKRSHEPFWLCAADDQTLRAYAAKLITFLDSEYPGPNASLLNIAYNAARQSNRLLRQGLIFHTDSIQNLKANLQSFVERKCASLQIENNRPVIMCFGGQVSTYIGLDRQVFEQSTVFKKHLDACDLVCRSMHLSGIYPVIFQKTAIEDTVQLQTVLFAMQYSCAQSWVDCGVKAVAVLGHSFGELVAQCVAGVMTLSDAMKLIARRATLIRDHWGSDRGLMMAIEGDLGAVDDLLAEAKEKDPLNQPATIACYNGPRSFTIAGSTKAIEDMERLISQDKKLSSCLRYVKLKTSHAFHSPLVESIVPELKNITNDVTFCEPVMRLERATANQSTQPLSSTYFADHLQQPVYFNHAVQRLAKDFQNAIWLEVGSQSTVTKMAAKALGNPKTAHFQAIDLKSDHSWLRLVESTIALWKQGLRLTFWPHHVSQSSHYTPLILPPYQFAMTKQFLELKFSEPPGSSSNSVLTDQAANLWTFNGYNDDFKLSARLRVETSHQTFRDLMAGHTVANSQPLCPSTLQLDIATEAIRSLCPEYPVTEYQIDLRNLENQSPICRDTAREVWLEVIATEKSRCTWSWKMVSNPRDSKNGESLHASGIVAFRRRDDIEFQGEFRRFERLVTHERCLEVLDGSSESKEIIQGTSTIYKLFADVVDYSEVFRGIHKIAGIAAKNESAGRVVKKYSGKTWLDTPLCDSFCQVAGVFVNCMTQRLETDAFISNGVERIVRTPFIVDFEENPKMFDVFALHHRPTDRSFASDVFIFDNITSQLLGVILGIRYQKVSKLAMAKLLTRLTPNAGTSRIDDSAISREIGYEGIASDTKDATPVQARALNPEPAQLKVRTRILNVLSEMVEIDPNEVSDSANLADLGIDSLMGMEVARDLESAFKCTMDMSTMASLLVLGDLIKWVSSAVGANYEDAQKMAKQDPCKSADRLDDSPESGNSSSTQRITDGSDNESKASSWSDISPVALPKLRLDTKSRQTAIDCFVEKYSSQFTMPSSNHSHPEVSGNYVLITGATGSLGAHLVDSFVNSPTSAGVICFNRPSSMDSFARQRASLEVKGIFLDEQAIGKLQVFASDYSKPRLGLDESAYARLVDTVTHVVHCAWPMSITRSMAEFEKQFVAMRNLIDLARDASYKLPKARQIHFQFISSIATVGLRPIISGEETVREEPTEVQYALPSGYSDAKLVCERLLSKTLGIFPERASTSVVRVGQVTGSKSNGYWNPAEHLSLLIKSAQALGLFPCLPGTLSWLPVNDVAAVISELSINSSLPSSPIYHVENPTRQSWHEMISLFASELGISPTAVIPYQQWLELARKMSHDGKVDIPIVKVMHFMENDFLRMACGGLILSTEKAVAASRTLRHTGPLQDDLIKSYVRKWRNMGFLH